VHPAVLENCGVDSERYTGFAFGMGPQRIAMLRHRITDIRLFSDSDVRFLRQFAK
jgi:phenylalanyl-tRNA synthetase alpha chain